MTDITPHVITSYTEQRLERRIHIGIGLILGCVLTLAAIPGTLTAAAERSAFDAEFMRSACMFPQKDGEAVTWARADGKIFCWELK